MKAKTEWKAAFAVTAAVAGTGFASGRELVLFFSQLGWAAWPGILCASALFGTLVSMTAAMAQKTGAYSFAGLCRRLPGGAAGNAATVLHGVLMVFAAAMMLLTAGELGALSLPVDHGFIHGMLIAFIMAAVIAMGGTGRLWAPGMLFAAAGILLYAALAADDRPARMYMRCETELALEGSVGASVFLAVLYACLNASVAGGTAASLAKKDLHPGRMGVFASGIMCALLAAGNLALLRGGRDIYAQALPMVILAARWGIAGFRISVLFMFMSSVLTLAAALGSLKGLIDNAGKPAGYALAAIVLLVLAVGTAETAGFAYPVSGWLCALFTAGTACCSEAKKQVFA